MRFEELVNDLDCSGCGEHLRGRSPMGPGDKGLRGIWQSIGRSVVVEKSTIERSPGKNNVVVHLEALCFACAWPQMQRSGGMLDESWRMPA